MAKENLATFNRSILELQGSIIRCLSGQNIEDSGWMIYESRWSRREISFNCLICDDLISVEITLAYALVDGGEMVASLTYKESRKDEISRMLVLSGEDGTYIALGFYSTGFLIMQECLLYIDALLKEDVVI